MQKTILKRASVVAFGLLILVIVGVLIGGASAQAYEQKKATIRWDIVNIRQQPTTSSSVVSKLALGHELIITDEKDTSDGYIWYYVKYTASGVQKQGWVRSDCIIIHSVDNDFEAYLVSQGFPETYKTKLRELHKLYPNWVFQAQHTNLNWDDVIKAESKLGMSLISGNSISSWKSTQNGAYNWDTGKWVGLDGDSWVAASEGIIKYYMDPRNFLDETYVFQFLEQSYNSNLQTVQGMQNVTRNTFLAGTYQENGTKKYIDTLMKAAGESGVSPYTLASMIIVEQGANGTGKSISGVETGYEGYYNFFNVGAYATSNMTAVQRGLWFAKGSGVGATSYNRPWNNVTNSIIGGAIHYGEGYVKVGQDTLYLKKFNVQGKNPYTHQYMTNVMGAATEGQRMSKAFNEEARNANLVFKIPVFTNMPTSACAKPTGDGSPNYMLKSLSVTGQNLTPTFDKYTTEYSLIVPNDITSVTIAATALDSNASITGTGKVNLKVGSNKSSIVVKAGNGTTRTYTINIIREEPLEPEKPDIKVPVLNSSVYTLNTSQATVAGIKVFPVNASTFAKNLKVENGSVKITDANGNTYSGNVGTGHQVRVYDTAGKLNKTYTVVLYGDTNGDGKVNSLDLLRVQKHIIKVNQLSGIYGSAADTSKDGKINSLDLLQVQKQIIGAGSIKQ